MREEAARWRDRGSRPSPPAPISPMNSTCAASEQRLDLALVSSSRSASSTFAATAGSARFAAESGWPAVHALLGEMRPRKARYSPGSYRGCKEQVERQAMVDRGTQVRLWQRGPLIVRDRNDRHLR